MAARDFIIHVKRQCIYAGYSLISVSARTPHASKGYMLLVWSVDHT